MFVSQPIDGRRLSPLLALNNEHARELSFLGEDEFLRLSKTAFFARRIGDDAFIFAFDENAAYESPNYLWFRVRHTRFAYVDRVVVSKRARGQGSARILYSELFDAARAAGHDRIVCEVNVRPPNPGSDAFHERLGFNEVGRAQIHDGAKLVRYLEMPLRG